MIRCPEVYDEAHADSQCLLEAGHDRDHLTDTRATGYRRRFRWAEVPDAEQFDGTSDE